MLKLTSLVIIFGLYVVECGASTSLRHCQRGRFNLDVVIAFGIAPIRNVFPHNLFRNGRTPNTVTEFTKVLLSSFDYRNAKVALVSFNDGFRTVAGFNNNRNRLWSAFTRWEPRPGAPDTATAVSEIRDLFSTSGRPNSRRLLILLTNRKSSQPDQARFQAAYARSEGIETITVGYDEAYRDQQEIRGISGSSSQTFTVSNPYFLPRLLRYVTRLICTMLRIPSPSRPPPPSPIATDNNPIVDEIVILADDSESTRDFAGLGYHYNNDSISFVDAILTNVDYSKCRVAIYLFSSNVRGLSGELTTNQTVLQSDVDNLQPSDNGFSTTNTADAISRASMTLTSSGLPNSNKYIVLLTDGQPDDILEAEKAAITARGTGIKIGILLSPLFDGQVSYRLSDMSRLVDLQAGDALKVIPSRASLASVVTSSFCPIAGAIFD